MVEEQADYVVVIRTRSGIFGDVYIGKDGAKAQEIAAAVRKGVEERPDERFTFNPPGFGMGAPCTFGAVSEVLVLKPGEVLPSSWYEPHTEQAGQFADALVRSVKE